LLKQGVIVGDARLGFILFKVAAASGGPSLLIGAVIPETAKGRFGQAVILRGVAVL
jgi:hypothetical protein